MTPPLPDIKEIFLSFSSCVSPFLSICRLFLTTHQQNTSGCKETQQWLFVKTSRSPTKIEKGLFFTHTKCSPKFTCRNEISETQIRLVFGCQVVVVLFRLYLLLTNVLLCTVLWVSDSSAARSGDVGMMVLFVSFSIVGGYFSV